MDAIQSTLDDLFQMFRKTDPDTSAMAASDAIKSGSYGRLLALRTLKDHWLNGLTDFELATATGWQQTSIGKRRGECVDQGWVENSGQKRPAPSGSLAIVWRITEAGIDYLTGTID